MRESDRPANFREIGDLILRSGPAVRMINIITLYRIVTFPLLVILAVTDNLQAFKWLLLASFFTDAIDGYLARRFNASSILGTKLDSIGDDLTVLAATIGLLMFRNQFIMEELPLFGVLFGLFLIQFGLSFYRYGKFSTFHTYLAKSAAVVTAIFLLSVFFLERVSYLLFYVAAGITALELIEEIILVIVLPEYRSNIKGLYWILRERKPR